MKRSTVTIILIIAGVSAGVTCIFALCLVVSLVTPDASPPDPMSYSVICDRMHQMTEAQQEAYFESELAGQRVTWPVVVYEVTDYGAVLARAGSSSWGWDVRLNDVPDADLLALDKNEFVTVSGEIADADGCTITLSNVVVQ